MAYISIVILKLLVWPCSLDDHMLRVPTFINCTEWSHCDISIYAYNVLCLNSLYYSFLSSTLPSLHNFNGFPYSVFIHAYEVLQSYSLSFIFSFHPLSRAGYHHKMVLTCHSSVLFQFGLGFFSGLNFTYERAHVIFVFLSLLFSLDIMLYSSLHFPASDMISFLFMTE
jgi:hypothetical protein